MPFAKGQSGNPGGRPKVVAEIKELARTHTAAAIQALVDICKKADSEAARVSAAVALLDRAYGKPAQTMDVTHRNAGARELSDDELLRIAAGSGKGTAEETSGEGQLSQLH